MVLGIVLFMHNLVAKQARGSWLLLHKRSISNQIFKTLRSKGNKVVQTIAKSTFRTKLSAEKDRGNKE